MSADGSQTIGELIRELSIDPDMRDFGLPCTVVSYDSESQTIEVAPLNDKANYLSVKLQTNPASGALYIPKVDSFVIVEQTSTSTAYVALWSELEEIVFFDGENKGMVKVSELVDKLNNLENKVNDLVNFTLTHIHPASAGTTSPTTTPVVGNLAPTQITDLENDKIKH